MKHAELALAKKSTIVRPIDFSGHWVNELESYMDLTITGTTIKGKYVSAVSNSGAPLPPVDLVGTISEDLISFTVNWGRAITAWTGHGVYNDDGDPQILTLWQMVIGIADETNPKQQWKTLQAGSDTFSREE